MDDGGLEIFFFSIWVLKNAFIRLVLDISFMVVMPTFHVLNKI